MSDKTERTKEEILSELTGHPIGNHNEDLLIEVDVCLKAMEEYRQSSPVESRNEIIDECRKFLKQRGRPTEAFLLEALKLPPIEIRL